MSDELKVTLGQYKGLKMKTQPVTVAAYEVEQEVRQALSAKSVNRQVNDRPVAMGDKILLNFAGFQDGVQFEGGTAENYSLIIGSHSFIDTFEDQLVGAEVGKEVEVNVTFPEHYGSAELAGKPARFLCTVTAIEERVIPELTDEFCQKHFDCDTVEDWKQEIRERLLAQKTQQMNQARIETLVQRVVEDSVAVPPAGAVAMIIENYMQGFEQQLMQQGMKLDQYCQLTGMQVEDMREQLRPAAENQVKTQMVLGAIADAEGITVSDEEVDERLARFAASYGMDPAELKAQLGAAELTNLKEEVLLNHAMEVILANVIDEAE